MRLIDWIWHIRGSLALAPGQSGDEAFEKLRPLFRTAGTSHEQADGTLVFQKRNQAAQDKMSVFDGGVLQIDRSDTGRVLHYDLTSRALLFCFLAPLLFLAIAQMTKVVVALEKPAAAADAKKPKPPEVQMNWIDKALGAPAPEKPKDGADEPEGRNKKPSTTPAYVFAAIFAVLYLVGRVLESKLLRALFRKRLLAHD